MVDQTSTSASTVDASTTSSASSAPDTATVAADTTTTTSATTIADSADTSLAATAATVTTAATTAVAQQADADAATVAAAAAVAATTEAMATIASVSTAVAIASPAVTSLTAATNTLADITTSNTSAFPFKQPAMSTLHASAKKAFAHYMVSFPISWDNQASVNDDYVKDYMLPMGEAGKYAASGGYIKERPLPRTVSAAPRWDLDDVQQDIKRASAAGLDGFTLDILGTTGVNWQHTLAVMTSATTVDANFKIVIMPDMTAEFAKSPANLVPAVIALSKYPSAYRLADGRLVLAPYNAQAQSVTWWAAQIAALKAAGVDVAFYPLFNGYQNYAPTFAAMSYGMSDWGARSPGMNAKWLTAAANAHAYGTKWMQTVSPQDFRPKSLLYTEAANSQNYRTMWANVITGGADWAHVVTWNDYSEGTEISPSSGVQWSFYDLTAYYVAWFKTGVQPTVTKDALYYFHRTMSTTAAPNAAKQSKTYSLSNGSDAATDTIEVLAFLTAPGTLRITTGSQSYVQTAVAGLNSFKVPLGQGTPTFELLRSNNTVLSLKSAYPISNSITYQDLLYRSGSSTRTLVAPQ